MTNDDTFANTTITAKEVSPEETKTTGTTGYSNFGTQNIHIYKPSASDDLASTTLKLADYLKDGTQITTYTIAIGEDSAFKDAANAVTVDADATVNEIASALTVTAAETLIDHPHFS